MIVVIPSARQISLDYLQPLIDSGARFIVVDDSEGTITVDHPQFEVYHWGDRRRILGELDTGFPKKNGACRDFGFYMAWKESDDDEIIVALDDDCNVYDPNFAANVEKSLSPDARPVASCRGKHLNVLDLYDGTSRQLYPRGFPYSARMQYDGITIGSATERVPEFCLGLWRGVFDINAIDKITGPEYDHKKAALSHESVAIASGKLVSVCSMNMQFRRRLVPAAYQLPMHVEVMPGWVVDRYGDIWGGFILKALMDIRGDVMVVGEPMIHHLKEGNYLRNIWQEHTCHLVNDEFIALLEMAAAEIPPAGYLEMMEALNEGFKRGRETCSAILGAYLDVLTISIDAWLKALKAAR